ncbi:Uu.00g140840.m01.CDS01 [Anthostomella pinea]|uniref:Uu.00g140840.m01.CDS01 n=1 Tax=Anthostomella pinea TaxID=933095 RepID=A0AAI8VR31_9PEZI|nr:Uu.00g140840.m01.CDS01 [Anthostomella pinea]
MNEPNRNDRFLLEDAPRPGSSTTIDDTAHPQANQATEALSQSKREGKLRKFIAKKLLQAESDNRKPSNNEITTAPPPPPPVHQPLTIRNEIPLAELEVSGTGTPGRTKTLEPPADPPVWIVCRSCNWRTEAVASAVERSPTETSFSCFSCLPRTVRLECGNCGKKVAARRPRSPEQA